MNAPRSRIPLLAALLLAAQVAAQTPVDPPPWWRVADDVTVSLYWSFDTPFPVQTFPPPTFAVVPPWYSAAVTGGTLTANVVHVPTFAGHVGVLGVLGTGTPQSGALDLTVDNLPYPGWVKVFWFQFEAFEGTGGDVVSRLEESLSYKRAIVSQKSESLGNGWERVTVEAQLIPQPDDEGIDWSFASLGGTVAIDNLFVSSKCVKPGPDETGDALGAVDVPRVPVPGAVDARGVAATEGPGPAFTKSYWLSVRESSAGVPHYLQQRAGTPPFLPQGTVLLPANVATVPQGPGDLAVQTRTVGGAVVQQIVWVVLDQRPAGLPVLLYGTDAATGTTAGLLQLTGFPPLALVPANQTLGLAWDPSGDLGDGTFLLSATNANGQGEMYEFRASNGTRVNPAAPYPIPPECTGLGYDDTLGNFYGFSGAPQATPTTPVHVNGFEWSGYRLDAQPLAFRPTGVRFCGDLTLNGTGPRGGRALGFDVYRSRANPTSQLNLVCLADTPNDPGAPRYLYELAGPFGFGWSVLGRCGMRDTGPFGGVPFLGGQLDVTLTGVPDTLFAALFVGFSNTTSPVGPLPLPLSSALGWPESVLSVSPDVNSPLLLPAAPGEFVFGIAIPPAAALAYAPVFFQWLALDASTPGFFAMTQAGKTVLYP